MPIHHLPPEPWTGRSDPEDGDQALRLHHLVQDKAPHALIGFACDAGVIRNKGRPGAQQGPTALRKALANLAAPESPQSFADLGDIEVTEDDLEAGQATLADHIGNALRNHDRIVVLGGGHETAFGSYCGIGQAYPNQKIGIINFDAHLDLRLVGDSGPSSGTPFTQIRALDPNNFDYLCIGIADESNTVALQQRARDWNVTMVSDHSLLGDNHAADTAIEAIIERSDLIYLTICLDVLPHYQAPGVSAAAIRGLPLTVIEYLTSHVLERCAQMKCPIPVTDVVELSPPHDQNQVTARTAAILVRQLLFS